MARLGRYFLTDQPLHVIQRGNNRDAIFFDADDHAQYRDWLAAAAMEYGCAIHAHVLMTNHVHLLLTPQAADSLPRTMPSLGRRYVRHVNTMSTPPIGEAERCGKGAIAPRRSMARPTSWPAVAISNSTRCEPGWSGIRVSIAGRAIAPMRPARSTRYCAVTSCLIGSVAIRTSDTRRIGRCSEPRSTTVSSTA